MRNRLLSSVPAPSLLAVLGLAVGLLPFVPTADISPELVTLVVLPPLLFASAQEVSLPGLRAVWRPVAALAVGLVLVSAAAVAVVARSADTSIGLAAAFTLGAVLASTDPVAVTALARRMHLPERISTLVRSESLLNDATSFVLFQVAAAAVVAGHPEAGHTTWVAARIAIGGLAVGVAVRAVARLAVQRDLAPSAILAVDVVVPYVAGISAYALDASVVTAVIVAGLGHATRSRRHRAELDTQFAARVYLNAVLVLEHLMFFVIGFELATFLRELPAGQRGHAAALAGIVTAALLAVRGLVLGVAAVAVSRRGASGGASYRPWQAAAVVTWAGTRGVVPLAAALSVPLTVDGGAGFPHRTLLLVVAMAVTVVTLVVQGTTLRPLVRKLGVTA